MRADARQPTTRRDHVEESVTLGMTVGSVQNEFLISPRRPHAATSSQTRRHRPALMAAAADFEVLHA